MSPRSAEEDAVDLEKGPASLSRANGEGAPSAEAPDEGASHAPEAGAAGLGEGGDEATPSAESSEPAEPEGPEGPEGPAQFEGPGETGESPGEQEPGDLLAEGADAWSIDPGIAELDVEEAVEFDGSVEPDEPFMRDELETDPGLDPTIMPPEMTQMLFVEVALMLPATHPVVVLQEADAPFRELRIPVGGAEGIAIAYAARGIETPRPLTHELFTRVLEEFTMTLDLVQITEVSGTSFSAEIVISGPMGARAIDCRPSDAIALALRQRLPVPIMAAPIVLAIAGTDPLGAN
jgi:bifunctional DNase/RNase